MSRKKPDAGQASFFFGQLPSASRPGEENGKAEKKPRAKKTVPKHRVVTGPQPDSEPSQGPEPEPEPTPEPVIPVISLPFVPLPPRKSVFDLVRDGYELIVVIERIIGMKDKEGNEDEHHQMFMEFERTKPDTDIIRQLPIGTLRWAREDGVWRDMSEATWDRINLCWKPHDEYAALQP